MQEIVDLETAHPTAYAAIVASLGYVPVRLRAYGNTDLVNSSKLFQLVECNGYDFATKLGDKIEQDAERNILNGGVLVTSYTPSYQRAAVVPLRWGCPRIMVSPEGIRKKLGENLNTEMALMFRLWRYEFDPSTDLVLSFAPDEGGIGVIAKRELHLMSALCKFSGWEMVDVS